MTKLVAALALAPIALAASPALADDDVPVTHTDQLVVVTPNPPIVISNGAPAAPVAAVAPVAPAAPASPGTHASQPPQNEDWSNVSHINGQLVKVGERNDYLLRYRKTNISTNPIGWMFGFYGLSVSHAVSSNLAVRLDGNIISFDGESGYELGVSLPIYFRRVYSGPFIEPGIIARGMTEDDCYDYYAYSYGGCSRTTDTMVGPEILFGWHWIFDSGLNVAVAFGAARDLTSNDDDYYHEDIQPAGYFRVGYAF
jgi:hypothetical protein